MVFPENKSPITLSILNVALQVVLIRKALRKKNVALKDVTVERVQGVQGKLLLLGHAFMS